MPKGVSRASAVQHLVSLSQMGGIGATAPAATPGTETPRGLSHGLHSSSSGRIAAAARAAAVRDSSPYKQPSNHWSPLGPTQDVSSRTAVAPAHGSARGRFTDADDAQTSASGSYSPRGPAGLATGGSYDFVLALGQDDGLMAYVSTLDMLFAPIVRAALWLQPTRIRGADLRGNRHARPAPHSAAPRRASSSRAKVRRVRGRRRRQTGVLTSRTEEARAALSELISIKTRVSHRWPGACCRSRSSPSPPGRALGRPSHD